MAIDKSSEEIKKAVKDHYSTAIKQKTSCCSTAPVEFDEDAAGRFVEIAGYSDDELHVIPDGITSFGCGNPVSFIDVKEGEVVLDLGSGAGLDLILASKKVGETGRVIGLDMTEEMIAAAKSNIDRAGVKNAELRFGEMEKMPVEDGEVNWIISNCVINLSPEKEKVFSESFRVLKPGGRMLVSDIVTIDLPDDMRNDLGAWAGCIAGAVEEAEYIQLMEKAGFTEVKVVDKIVYDEVTVNSLANDACGCGTEGKTVDTKIIGKYAGKVASVRVSAVKPD